MDEYRLAPTDIRQMLADPDFYAECPAFSFLAPRGLVAATKWLNCVRTRGTPEYPGLEEEQNALQELQLVIGSFAKHVQVLADLNANLLQPLRQYIEGCLDARPATLRLVYHENGEQVNIAF